MNGAAGAVDAGAGGQPAPDRPASKEPAYEKSPKGSLLAEHTSDAPTWRRLVARRAYYGAGTSASTLIMKASNSSSE